MSLADKLFKRRALRLKVALAEGDGRPKPGIFSTIYPATDHGENMPHVVKTSASIPSSNDKEGEESELGTEKGQKEVDEPGPTKTTSFSQPAVPGQSAMVPDAHKRAAFELGYFGENRSDRFIKRCVELITGVKKLESHEHEVPGDDDEGNNGENGENGNGENGDASGEHEHSARSRLSDIAKKFQKDKSDTYD